MRPVYVYICVPLVDTDNTQQFQWSYYSRYMHMVYELPAQSCVHTKSQTHTCTLHVSRDTIAQHGMATAYLDI